MKVNPRPNRGLYGAVLLKRTLLLSLAFLLIGGIARPQEAEAACNTTPTVFSTAVSTTYPVPTDCTSLTIKVWGAGGGGGGADLGPGAAGAAGGGGGFATSVISVGNETLDIV